MNIHPTATVSAGAILAEDVEVGAHAIVGDQVALGAGCIVRAHAILEGPTVFGEKNIIGYGAVIGAPSQDPEVTGEGSVRIGNGNTFREYVTIHRGTSADSETVVGDGCYLMVGVHLGGNVRVGNKVIIANNCVMENDVEIGDGAVLGGGAVLNVSMRTGRLCMLRGGARYRKDLPPYTMGEGDDIILGINAIGIRRAGFSPETRLEIKRAFKLLWRSGLEVSEALAKAAETEWSPEAQAIFDFVAGTKVGVCVDTRKSAGDDED